MGDCHIYDDDILVSLSTLEKKNKKKQVNLGDDYLVAIMID